MKSIKPGRGSSMEGGFAAVFACIFGVIWTIGASSIGAPPLFTVFGIVFILFAVVKAGFSFYNATAENRPSVFDIVEDHEEPDPLNVYFGKGGEGHVPDEVAQPNEKPAGFCPYCGAKVQNDYAFCAHCGKELPKKNQ